jgi:inorganic pyrophosphatase
MADLTSLPLQLDDKTCICRAIIETPKGWRNKFDYDPDTGLFKLGGLLPEGMMFPFDFGFLPSTLGQDGGPLDVTVLADAQVEEFFVSYNKQRGKKFKVTGTGGQKKAIGFLKNGIRAHRSPRKK